MNDVFHLNLAGRAWERRRPRRSGVLCRARRSWLRPCSHS